ncbi:DUF2721 domain-containing protein [Longimicrobium terrae]|uniref:DUF2721 domain-containing protein n=1 Tax=Longimicrobium terrae TaxID=1639882 RepID=A0A841GZ38_9BACT|nr:DUF2721 domain-containing protein [Longimicrobium terrae]MBB4636446.1 hypothetical protein [Longimicrobium terrae]MBB6071030.1 hypothetical protein [Longimicrobium terrae]NNC29051.1 DUF2721 domain-containing protein [Longimicrobium terrae]
MQNTFELSSTLAALSAMVTPAVLILASSSLVLATSNRLTRAVDRTRSITESLVDLADADEDRTMLGEERELLLHLLERTARRTKLLTRALTRLYMALAIFIATSTTLGVVAALGTGYAWIALVLGMTGAALLFWASLLLILESRLSLRSVYEEMEFVRRIGEHYGPALTPATPPRRTFRRWRRERGDPAE